MKPRHVVIIGSEGETLALIRAIAAHPMSRDIDVKVIDSDNAGQFINFHEHEKQFYDFDPIGWLITDDVYRKQPKGPGSAKKPDFLVEKYAQIRSPRGRR